jgi:hypothetical protein
MPSLSLYEERRLTVHPKTPPGVYYHTQADQKKRVKATGSRSSGRLLNGSILALLGRNFPAPRDRRRWLGGSAFASLGSNSLLGRSLPAAFAEGNASSHTRMYLAEALVCPGLKGSEADTVEFSTAPCGLRFVGSALPLLALRRVLESYVGRGYNPRHKT